jgi:hypothetical protein
MTQSDRRLRALIRFLTIDEGGRLSWAEDGIRPQLKLGEISTSCTVRSAEGARQFEPGVEHLVDLELMHWDHYGHLIDLREPVVLLEGSRVVARGAYIEPSPEQ